MIQRPPRTIHIHYLRPPDRVTVFTQQLVYDDGRVKVTYAHDLSFDPPLRILGRTALESGSDAVWFTFPGAWHDIGRFHRADGTLTGIYANVITPCVFQPGGDWETTDLFLDVWVPADEGEPVLLDAEELTEAERRGWIAGETAARARAEGKRLLAEARSGSWPAGPVREWTRERALSVARGPLGPSTSP